MQIVVNETAGKFTNDEKARHNTPTAAFVAGRNKEEKMQESNEKELAEIREEDRQANLVCLAQYVEQRLSDMAAEKSL